MDTDGCDSRGGDGFGQDKISSLERRRLEPHVFQTAVCLGNLSSIRRPTTSGGGGSL